MQAVTLSTDRLILRPFADDDLEPFAALGADREVRRYYTCRLSLAQSEQLAASMRPRMLEQGWGFWVVELRDEARFAEFASLNRPEYVTPFTSCFEIGWQLARRYWGRGYATEAGRAPLRFASTHLRLDEVVSFTTHANLRSRTVMQRLGMTRDFGGDFDHPRVPLGHPFRPHVLYRLPRQQ